MYTSSKTITNELTVSARCNDGAVSLDFIRPDAWLDAQDGLNAIDNMISFLADLREYVFSQMDHTPVFGTGGVFTLGTDQVVRDERGRDVANGRFGELNWADALKGLRKVSAGGGGGADSEFDMEWFKTPSEASAPGAEMYESDCWWRVVTVTGYRFAVRADSRPIQVAIELVDANDEITSHLEADDYTVIDETPVTEDVIDLWLKEGGQ